MRTISHWNNLSKVVDSPALGTFKIQLDRVRGHLVIRLLTRKFAPEDP